MNFTNARAIEQLVWQMRLADYPRSKDRARINGLANGDPPYGLNAQPEREINVNDLSLTRLSHDARLQLYQAHNKPGNFFTARTDMSAQSKRAERGSLVTGFINRKMKRNDFYFETHRSQFALEVLHGIGPSNWDTPDRWCPVAVGIEDVMIPSRTLLTFQNLPFFAVWRGFTGVELKRLTRHPESNPGWNMPVVERAIKWIDEQTAKLWGGTTWAEYWVPEKWTERFKEDSGVYASDLVPTIDCWDFYYWDDEGGHEGWRRRIVFDAEGGYGAWGGDTGYGEQNKMPEKNLLGDKGLFLYDSGNRVVADRMSEIMHFQFADLSAVAPFRYHSVRSLGFLLYAACHLQNRLRCSFSEAVFENLMMYMRVSSLDDAERALKIELANRGIIDETVHFLNPTERWNPNAQLAEAGMNEFKQIIADNSSSYVQNNNLSRDRVEKTKFQVMAEVNAMQTLVGAALQQSYRYAASEYREIFRRFMKRDSTDPDVIEFRGFCKKNGIPDTLLVPDAWDIEPERIMGSGNKTLEMAIAQQLMEWRAAYAPHAQQQILRMATLATVDDAAVTKALVPEEPGVSNAKKDATLAVGSLMAGGKVEFTEDQNRIELAQTLLVELSLLVNQVKATGGMVSDAGQLIGFQNFLKHVSELIAEISQDKAQGELAKKMAQASGNLANEIKGFAQRFQQKQKAEASKNGNGGMDAETRAKVAATLLTAKVKAANTRESHAQRTAQRQAQSELEMQQRERENKQQLRHEAQRQALDVAAQDLKTASEIRRSRKVKPDAGV